MATITANGSKGHHSFELVVTESSYDVNDNSSEIAFTFKIKPRTTGYDWSGYSSKIKYTITINGTNYTGSIGSYNGSSTVTLKSGTQYVAHDSDGSKTINLSFSVTDTSGQSYTCGNASNSGTLPLTTIPRESYVNNLAVGPIGGSISGTIVRYSNSFTHTVYIKHGNRTQTILTKSSSLTFNATIDMAFCNEITVGNSSGVAEDSAFVCVDTYNGDKQIGDTVSSGFTMEVPSSVVPTITSLVTSDTASYYSTYNAFVQGKSNLKVEVTPAMAYSSPITGVTIKIKNSNNTVLRTIIATKEDSHYDATISKINDTGSLTVEAIVKDDRNRTNSSTTPITVATYSNPKITTLTAERRNNDSTVTLQIAASITNINSANANSKTFKLYKRQAGTSSWGSAILTYNSAYSYSNNAYTVSCDENYGWEFKLEATDSFTTTAATTSVGTAFELINWGADGTSMAIGKVSSNSYTFDVDLNTKLNKNVTIGGYTNALKVEGISNKNMIGGWFVGSINSTTGADNVSDTARRTDYIPVDFTTNSNYIISGLPSGKCSVFVNAYNSSKQSLGRTGALVKSTQTTITMSSSSFNSGTPQGTGAIKYLRINLYNPDSSYTIDQIISSYSTIQLEIGSSATTYVESKDYGYISGSNANGNYMKYDDGTLICWNRITVSSISVTSAEGSLFKSDNLTLFPDYPISFVSYPSFSLEAISDDNTRFFWLVKSQGDAIARIRGFRVFSATSLTLSNAKLSYIAIGRWK